MGVSDVHSTINVCVCLLCTRTESMGLLLYNEHQIRKQIFRIKRENEEEILCAFPLTKRIVGKK